MSEKKPGFIVRAFKGLWNFLDVFRRTVVNLVFLFLLIIVLVAISQGSQTALPKEKTALVLAPKGMIVEEYSADPFERALNEVTDNQAPETRLRDLIRAVGIAKNDSKIDRLVLVPDDMWSGGPAQLKDLATAIDDFKASGKSVFTYAEGMSQGQYYFAALADEIWLNPEGFLMLEGFGRYRSYYKEGLDKLGVDVNLFKVGTYKSAAEPFIRNDMSEASREANLHWMGDLWDQYLQDTATRRGLDVEAINPDLETLNQALEVADGNFATMALNMGLVDKLGTRNEMRAYLSELGVQDEDHHSFRQVHFQDYLKQHPQLPASGDKIGVVVAQGAIMGGDQPPGTVGGDSTSRLLRKARYDDDVKVVVMRVDSPGGGVFASEQIRQEVLALKAAGKPVVVSMGTVAASGGYWISMNADEIWAQPNTITGSIGIFGLLLSYPETLKKIGIHTDGVGTTELAGALRADRPFNEKVGGLIQQNIDRGYRNFIGRVGEARNMSMEQVDSVAQGRVWSGLQAMEHGLVDKMGGLREAITSAAALAGLDDKAYQIRYIEPELDGFQQFLLDLSAKALVAADLEIPLNVDFLPLDRTQQMQRDLKMLMGSNKDPSGMYAHCLCTVD